MQSFKDKVAVITGAGSGMGQQLAINLAKENCNLVICDINKKTIQETEEIIRNYNVADPSQSIPRLIKVKELMVKIEDRFWREKKINEVAVSINNPVDLVRIPSTLFCSSDGRCSFVLGLIVVVFAKLITPLDDVFGCCHDG